MAPAPANGATNGTNGALETDVTYEDLIALEQDFDDADQELVRSQEKVLGPLYKKRAAIVSRIPNFWALVLEQAPPDFDQFVQPSDSQVFAEALRDVKVERFEVDEAPRSLKITFEFAENEWFRDTSLEKKLYWRRTADGWAGLVSEPVAIEWKGKDKDLTGGLTDAAVRLWKARQGVNTDGRSADKQAALKEHKSLAKRLESNDPSSSSFFTFFGFVSERRYVSAAESKEATKKAKAKKNAKAPKDDEDADGQQEEEAERVEGERAEVEQAVEICPHGAEVAGLIAENIWPHAIKYFTSAQEAEDEDLSEASFESDDEEQEEDDDEGQEIDIRALVKGKSSKRGKNSGSDEGGSTPPPPAKARRT